MATLPIPLFAQSGAEFHNILVLHDSADTGIWRRTIDNRLYEILSETVVDGKPVRINTQYLGLDVIPDDVSPVTLVEQLSFQNRLYPASLVVAVLPAAVNFVEQWNAEIWGATPKIYINVNPDLFQLDPSEISSSITILEGDHHNTLVSTLNLIPQTLPHIQRVLAMASNGVYGRAYADVITRVVAGGQYPLEIEPLQGLSGIELAKKLANYSSTDTVLLLMPYDSVAGGDALQTVDVFEQIVKPTELPVFTTLDSVMGLGAIGGAITRPEVVAGSIAAEIKNILSGPPNFELNRAPIDLGFYFDDRQLSKWGIDRQLLPSNSVIEYADMSVWRTYQFEIIIAVIVITAQLLLIATLFRVLRKRRIAERGLVDQANALGEQINLFESVINSIPDAILVSNVDREIYSVNRSVRTLFDFEPKDLIGKKTFTLLKSWSSNAGGTNREAKYASSDREYIKPVILEYKKRNGEVFSGETIETKIISARGDELGYFSLIRDVSRRLIQEEEVKQSQKMEALGNLVGGIAHDFNNVLGMITAHSEVLHFQSDQLRDREGLAKIIKATHRGAEICNQILTFSRNTGVEQTNINLLDVVKETLKLLTVSIPNRISLKLNCYGNLFLVNANFTQIQQVIMNLATNASHAIGETNGTIEITVRCEELAEEKLLFQSTLPAGNFVCLSVKDTGSGISGEVLQKIFEPFFSTKGKSHGAGLGMAMVYSITKSHSGYIHIESSPEQGTEVQLYLPQLEASTDAALENAEFLLVKGNGERILLVDDEIDLLESVEQLLVNIGYQVTAFKSPKQAIEYFSKHHAEIDVLLSDQSMPEHSGIELVKLCRTIKPELPVVLCTGYSEILDAESIGGLHLNAVVRKPFTIAEISSTLAEALKQAARVTSHNF